MKLVVVSHALIQEAARARWLRLSDRYPVDVTLLVPAYWESNRFGNVLKWNPQPVSKERYRVLPLPVLNYRSWSSYLFKSIDGSLVRIKADVIYVVQEEMTLVHHQFIEYRRLWAKHAKLVFFSCNNISIPMQKWYQRLLWNHTCEGTDMAIAHSSEVTHVLRNAGFQKPIAIQTEIGVDETAFYPDKLQRDTFRKQLNLNGFVIGFAGQVVLNKGILDLVEACLELDGDWNLLIVGDGPLRLSIEEQFITLGLSSRLRLTGYIPLEEMPKYMRVMDCLVLPSRTELSCRFKEQFGLVLAQGMACGVPVIGSDSGAIPEVIADAGLIFTERDIGGLRKALQRLMNDQSIRLELAERGYQRCLSHYSAEVLAEETYNMFSRLLGHG